MTFWLFGAACGEPLPLRPCCCSKNLRRNSSNGVPWPPGPCNCGPPWSWSSSSPPPPPSPWSDWSSPPLPAFCTTEMLTTAGSTLSTIGEKLGRSWDMPAWIGVWAKAGASGPKAQAGRQAQKQKRPADLAATRGGGCVSHGGRASWRELMCGNLNLHNEHSGRKMVPPTCRRPCGRIKSLSCSALSRPSDRTKHTESCAKTIPDATGGLALGKAFVDSGLVGLWCEDTQYPLRRFSTGKMSETGKRA